MPRVIFHRAENKKSWMENKKSLQRGREVASSFIVGILLKFLRFLSILLTSQHVFQKSAWPVGSTKKAGLYVMKLSVEDNVVTAETVMILRGQ